MATENVEMTGDWVEIHEATANNTNVVVTPRAFGMEWAIDTVIPSDDLEPHILSDAVALDPTTYRDRGFVMASGEILYVRGPATTQVAVTIEV